ncbi:hypothetical protein Dsin_028004 [Dipteronia sinensis]|uniref:Uncharacterized protein n=1 Tax=Dipteronia sinensis TaxID=43782 RepID=A0AAD9ZPJ1_9ROSI|nr:hypothetical protein Dsin_028004 [Dipteronia sinensis]
MEDHLIEKNNGLNGQIDLDETEDQGSDSFVTPLAQYKPHDGHLGLRRRRTNVSYSEDDHQHQETHIQNKDDLYRLEQLDLTSLDLTRLQQLEPMSVSDIYFESFYRLEQLVPMPLIQRPSDSPLISKFLNCVSFGGPMADKIYGYLKKIEPQLFYKPVQDGHFGLRRRRNYNLSSPLGATLDLISWLRDDDSLLNRLIDLGEVDVVSQMIKAAAGTDCNLNLGTASVVTARHTEQRITPSSLLPNTPHRINIKEGNSNDEEVHGKRQGWSQKVYLYNLTMYTFIARLDMIFVF